VRKNRNEKSIAFRIPDAQRKLLVELADSEDRTVSATIRRAVDEYIKREGKTGICKASLGEPVVINQI